MRVRLTFGGDEPSPMPALACHGPLLEDEVISSPIARLEAVALHPCLTPTILGVATRVSKMEFDARQNSRMGDAVFAEEVGGSRAPWVPK